MNRTNTRVRPDNERRKIQKIQVDQSDKYRAKSLTARGKEYIVERKLFIYFIVKRSFHCFALYSVRRICATQDYYITLVTRRDVFSKSTRDLFYH